MVDLQFNEERAVELFTLLEKMWDNKEFVYKNQERDLVRHRLPKFDDPVKEANFLLCASMIHRAGVKAEPTIRWYNKLYERAPEVFDPYEMTEKWSVEELESLIKEISLDLLGSYNGKHGAGPFSYKLSDGNENILENWYHNLEVVNKRFENNALNIFEGVSNSEEAFRKVRSKKLKGNGEGFKGIGRKIFSLWTMWLQEFELVPMFPTTLQIDFHAQRILWATEVLEIETKPLKVKNGYKKKRRERLKAIIGKPSVMDKSIPDRISLWSMEFLPRHGFNHLKLGSAMWVWSRELCTNYIQNRSFTYSDGSTGYRESDELKNDSSLWPKSYRDFCGICDLNKLCKWSIPSKPYYKDGFLVRLGERVEYPQMRIQFNELEK